MDDDRAIQTVLSAYSHSIGLRDLDATLRTFRPDGIWDLEGTGIRCEGHDAIRETLVGIYASLDYLVQINAPAMIAVTGDHATARYTIRECGKRSGTGQAFEAFGVYDDTLVRGDGGWKLDLHKFRMIASHTYTIGPPLKR